MKILFAIFLVMCTGISYSQDSSFFITKINYLEHPLRDAFGEEITKTTKGEEVKVFLSEFSRPLWFRKLKFKVEYQKMIGYLGYASLEITPELDSAIYLERYLFQEQFSKFTTSLSNKLENDNWLVEIKSVKSDKGDNIANTTYYVKNEDQKSSHFIYLKVKVTNKSTVTKKLYFGGFILFSNKLRARPLIVLQKSGPWAARAKSTRDVAAQRSIVRTIVFRFPQKDEPQAVQVHNIGWVKVSLKN